MFKLHNLIGQKTTELIFSTLDSGVGKKLWWRSHGHYAAVEIILTEYEGGRERELLLYRPTCYFTE